MSTIVRTVALLPLAAAGAGLAGVMGFVVVLGSGGTSTNAAASPTFNIDALPPAAQDYLPYLNEGGLVCSDVDAALLASQISVLDPSWGPAKVTNYTYTYTSTTGTGKHKKTRTVTVTITYEGLLQQTASWWAANGYSAQQANAPAGSADPFDPEDAIHTLALYDCALAAQLNVETLSKDSGVPVDQLIAAAFNDGAGAVANYALSAHSVPPDLQTQSVVGELALYSLGTSPATGQPSPGQPPAPGGTTPPGGPAPSAIGEGIIQAAQSELGVPYSWGGGNFSGPTLGFGSGANTVGFDCSGLVLYAVYQASGGAVALPHYSGTQVAMGQQVFVGNGGAALSSGLLQPGDIVGFYNLDNDNTWDHIGIYIGNGDMIDAPQTGSVVRVDNLATSYWEGVQWDVRRFG